MRGINKVTLIGNLGNDPDVRYTPSGDAVANLSLATDESYKDKQTGQVVPQTEWHRVAVFGKLAELCKDYLRKGSKIYVEGKLKTRKWTDNNNVEKYSTEIVVNTGGKLLFLDSRDQNQTEQPAPQQQNQQPQQQNQQQQSMSDDFDEDIPF